MVRVTNLNINFDQLAETVAKIKTLEGILGKIKGDLFNLVKQYESALGEKTVCGKMERFKEEPKDMEEDASVSLKID